jgi:polysaccharide deacetylase family protein (PEP-CTERM system associated)
MNILTFDIEEWYIEKTFHGAREQKYNDFEEVLEKILDLLDEVNTKATFFCLGKIAKDFPAVIKKIHNKGHEIGCHSDKHLWINKLTYDGFLEDTQIAIETLEHCTGKKVLSYRAPAFSIGDSNKWAFEVLTELGIERDASVFPAVRDYGGFASFEYKTPVMINYNGFVIKEFPVSTIKLLSKDVAYSGGGYFRLFPLSFILKNMKLHPYSMTYFHIGDLLPGMKRIMTKEDYEKYFKENGNLINRYKRYIKSNLGTKGAFNKLAELIKADEFISLAEADTRIDWNQAPKIEFK